MTSTIREQIDDLLELACCAGRAAAGAPQELTDQRPIHEPTASASERCWDSGGAEKRCDKIESSLVDPGGGVCSAGNRAGP